jgi:hypothetical protein
VADDRARLDPVRAPERRQRDHHREQGRLDDLDAPIARLLAPPQLLLEREVEVGSECLLAEPGLIGEDRRVIEQLVAHSRPLPALAGEDEGEPAGTGPAANHARVGLAGAERVERRQQLLAVGADRDGTPGQPRAGGERSAGVQRVELGMPPQVSGQPAPRLRQRVIALRRERQRDRGQPRPPLTVRPLAAVRRLARSRGGRRLLQDQVRVGATEAEGGDAGAARAAVGLPGLGLVQQLDRAR